MSINVKGLLRLLLALAVLIAHASFYGAPTVDPLALLQPQAIMAVEAFFIISGFYMALIGWILKLSSVSYVWEILQ